MRILIVSKEVWTNKQNGGNTLTSLFSMFPNDTEFAQIYCSAGSPDNDICNTYFNLTTKQIAKTIIKGGTAGEIITTNQEYFIKNDTHTSDISNSNDKEKSTMLSKLTNNESFRNLVWLSGKYKSPQLKKFITDFNPDIIFAPGYGVKYMNYLIQWIYTFTSCPVVSLISDDYYTFNPRSLNPFYYIDLISLRRTIRKSVKGYNLIYTMTEVQKRQLEKDFNVPVKILVKSGAFDMPYEVRPVGSPIRLVYAGNLYLNRWKTLQSLKDAIININNEHLSFGKKLFHLDIYSNGALEDDFKKMFNTEFSDIHNVVSIDELKKIYSESDIALHVESFDLINKEKTRMSFSTKIIDCIFSTCAIMCICDKNQGGYEYLSKNDAALCIDNPSKIKDCLKKIADNPDILNKYQYKAYNLGINKHSQNIINTETYNDFKKLISD